MAEKATKEVEATVKQEGDRAAFETGVMGLHPELLSFSAVAISDQLRSERTQTLH
jgi:hypothetical protein